MKNNLNEILGIKTSFKIKEDNNIQISSRSINNKSIFFAFQGVNSHASEYINDALNKGAELVIHDDKKYQSDKENIFYIQDLRKRFLKFLIIFYGINLKKYNPVTLNVYFSIHEIISYLNIFFIVVLTNLIFYKKKHTNRYFIYFSIWCWYWNNKSIYGSSCSCNFWNIDGLLYGKS